MNICSIIGIAFICLLTVWFIWFAVSDMWAEITDIFPSNYNND